MNEMYCVRCKSTSAQNVFTKSNRPILKSIYVVCRYKKSTFIATKTGKGIVNSILNSEYLPELHLLGHSYTGPGTKLQDRQITGPVLNQSKPINRLAEKAQFHDMTYHIFKGTKDCHVFDKKRSKRNTTRTQEFF